MCQSSAELRESSVEQSTAESVSVQCRAEQRVCACESRERAEQRVCQSSVEQRQRVCACECRERAEQSRAEQSRAEQRVCQSSAEQRESRAEQSRECVRAVLSRAESVCV